MADDLPQLAPKCGEVADLALHPSPALAALFAMFIAERVPVPLAERYCDRYMAEAYATETRPD